MKNAILISETCDEGTGAGLYDYDKLPKPVKDAVDAAMNDDGTIECDIYAQGLQFMWSYIQQNNLPKNGYLIEKDEVVNYIGGVELFDN